MQGWDVAHTAKIDRAVGTRSFRFERPPELEYLPGQFFFISIPEDSGWLRHHFSFSSSPTEPFVEFTTRMTGSQFKGAMGALPVGTVVGIEGPQGGFVAAGGAKKAAFVSGGIGVTPARSTIRWAVDTGADLDIVLLWANRDSKSTAFAEEFAAIDSERVRVVNVLSEPEEGWTGRTGLIDAALVRAEVPDLDERHFYVSGPPAMVDAMASLLSGEVGIPGDRLTIEHFTGY